MVPRVFASCRARLRRWLADQRGSTLLVVALSMIAILSMLALVVDAGYAYGERRQMQNAADAGALAGMRVYWIDKYQSEAARKDAAKAAACQYATLNGAATCSAAFLTAPGVPGNSPSAYILRVNTSRTFSTFFAGIMGVNNLSVSAIAKAQVQGLKGTSNLWPVIVKKDAFEIPSCHPSDPCGSPECPTYEVWNSENDAPGNAGWVNWNRDGQVGSDFPCPDQGEPNLECELLDTAASGYWEVGDWVPGNPGLKDSSGVRDAVEGWMCRHVTVPVWDQITGTGDNTQYRIGGFAEFVLTDFGLTSTPKTIRGQFIRWADTGESTYEACENFNYECTIHLVP